jgi:DNA-nicking Smr family endonuclease
VRRKPSPEDIELFRRTVGAVKPLSHEGVARPAAAPGRRQGRARPKPAPLLESLEESPPGAGTPATAEPDVSLGEPLSHRRPGVPDSVVRRLRRGQFAIDAELDLHGLTVPQAKDALRGFLASALARHFRCLRIIHGKGLRSGQRGPVLKAFVSSALRQTPFVAAFVSARPADGGTGVLLVLLS